MNVVPLADMVLGVVRRQMTRLTPLLLLLVTSPSWIGCSREQGQNAQTTVKAGTPVELDVVRRMDVEVHASSVGTVEAVHTVAIVPEVSGRIVRVEFEEGAFVKRGDPLFVLDTRPYSASLAAAQAELARSEAAAAQAVAEAERYTALAREGLASEQERTQREAEVKSARAAVQAAHAAISSARLNVQFATVRAPIDGRTGALMVTEGNVVQPSSANPLVMIRSISPIKVSFDVPPELLSRVRDRGKVLPLVVRASTRGEGSVTALGTLTFVDNTVRAGSGTLTLKATFANEDGVLWPGDFVDVVLVLGKEEQVVVAPEAAVADGQSGPYAFVVDDEDIAHLRPLTVRRRTDEYVVVEQGLTPGERIVVNGALRLRDGSAVAPKQPTVGDALR
jgi:multidrug efflux system membrane fusion protein